MGKYIGKRILLLVPAVFLVCVIVFALKRLVPGDAVDSIIYKYSSMGISADRAEVEAMLGLDQPAVAQFFTWLKGVLTGDLGDSLFEYESVASIIGRQLPVTLELGILTLLFSCILSIPIGLFCAAKQDSLPDYAFRVVAILLVSIPVFWIATMVIIYPSLWWGYAPPTTYVSFFENPLENLRMFIIPALLGALMQAGIQMRTVRTMTLEVMRLDYIRTAWAKGTKERVILFKHAFRNAMIPVVTMIGGSAATMIGGSVIMESVFNIPGIGQQVITALGSRDYPLVQGCVLVFAIFVMIINLVVDVCYKWIDPRINLD